MEPKNNVARMKELITIIRDADKAYYGDDDPIMTDKEYDALMDELKALEASTGIVFANSPSKRVGGFNKEELKEVQHSKPMLSAKKTKSVDDLVSFAFGNDVMLSWKMDGLSLILRYEGGCFKQAVTRGEEGLVGEDVTHTARSLRNVPQKVNCKDRFEVRGEGVVSWADYQLLNRGNAPSHPRNVAAGLVRSLTPDKGSLSHMDFYAFELLLPGDPSKTKEEQLDFLSVNGFTVVEHTLVRADSEKTALKNAVAEFDPEQYDYPVDGIIAEYNDISYGKSLGATTHHENRMLALKWEDGEYETVFRGVELTTTRNGLIALSATFDPVMIDGTVVKRADLHSVSNFEKYKFGVGDTIKVYKANMIIPQISENVTQSGTYKLPERCPCCGSLLEMKVSSGSIKNLYCPNEECIARNAQKIAHFCDKSAMNMEGFNASVLEKLMAYGIVKTFADLYHLEKHRGRILTTPGFGYGIYDKLVSSVENSRRCHLAQFLVAVGIPLMGPNNARAIDEYFLGSWDAFEKAIKEEFCFFHIAGVSQALSRNIYTWYADETEEKLWRPVLKEITFVNYAAKVGEAGNPFSNANVVVTGTVNGMNRKDITELLTLLGAFVSDSVTQNTTYLIVGEAPGTKKLSAALNYGTKIITEGHFAKMLGDSDVGEDEESN